MAVISLKTLHLSMKKSNFSQRNLYVCLSMLFLLSNVNYFCLILPGSHLDPFLCPYCRLYNCRHKYPALISLVLCDKSRRISLFRSVRAYNFHWFSLFILRYACRSWCNTVRVLTGLKVGNWRILVWIQAE